MFFSPELVEQLILHLPNPVFWKDNNFIYRGCNYNFLKLFRLDSPNQIIGHTDNEIPWLKDLAQVNLAEDREILENGRSIVGKRVSLKLLDNEERVYLLDKIPLYDEKLNATTILGTLTDITTQEKFSNELDQAMQIQKAYLATLNQEVTGQFHGEMSVAEYADQIRNYLESIIAYMPGNVYWLNRDCILLGGNDNLAKMFGLKSRADLVGLDYEQMTKLANWTEGQGESFKQAELKVMASGIPRFNVEEPPVIINGETRYYMSNKVPLFNKQKEIIGVVGISLDVTDKKLSEIAIYQKELAEAASKSKSEFIANMSHDIRTPLTGLLGMAKIIQQEVSSEKGKEATENLLIAANTLLELHNSIIEFSKLESGELSVCDAKFSLKALVDGLVALTLPAAQEKGINLQIDYDERIPNSLIGDKTRIHRILLNLVGNAIKFTQVGGVNIFIKLAKITDKDVILKLIVKDTGIGIPQDKQQIIFSRFSRLSPSYTGIYKGYGLGLSIVKQFVSELDGEIDVVSKEGEGSTFTCILPLKRALLDEADDQELKVGSAIFDVELKEQPIIQEKKPDFKLKELQRAEGQAQDQLRVLVVEDNKLAQLAATHQLEQIGCAVDIAGNGEDGLSLAMTNHYDLIFMDIGLPDKSGCEVTAEIRKWEKDKGKHTPIVALTAHVDKSNRQECLVVGMEDVLTKPLDAQKAQEVFEKYVPASGKIKQPIHGSDSSTKVIDLKQPQEKFGYNEETAKEMLKMFMDSLNGFKIAIEEAHQKSDLEILRFHVHKLQGGAIYCGVPRVLEAARELETAINEKHAIDRINQLYSQLLEEILTLQEEHKKLEMMI